jgi:hypothetical protein
LISFDRKLVFAIRDRLAELGRDLSDEEHEEMAQTALAREHLPAGVRGGPACYGPQVSAAVIWSSPEGFHHVHHRGQRGSVLRAGHDYLQPCR